MLDQLTTRPRLRRTPGNPLQEPVLHCGKYPRQKQNREEDIA